MAKYKFVVFTMPVEGREDDYNTWYNDIHIPEMLAIDGFTAAKRYRLKQPMGEHETFPYMAVYELEADSIDDVLANVAAKRDSLSRSDAVTTNSYRAIYEDI